MSPYLSRGAMCKCMHQQQCHMMMHSHRGRCSQTRMKTDGAQRRPRHTAAANVLVRITMCLATLTGYRQGHASVSVSKQICLNRPPVPDQVKHGMNSA